jgi:adenine phosphoribosyltransferase
MLADLEKLVRSVPDFPKPGILFRDITPLLASPEAWAETIEQLSAPFRHSGITQVAGIESRGFFLGGGVARSLHTGFVPIRKAGKLPAATHAVSYELEYGTDTVEVHTDAFGKGDKVLIVDDLLATGGTLAATVELVRKTGATVAGAALLIELGGLDGRSRVADVDPLHVIMRLSAG